MSRYALCPCDSKAFYPKCCAPYHSGARPETAVALMRSRYSAYALDMVEYIIDTTHPNNPQNREDLATWREDLHKFAQSTQFVNLKILEFIHGDAVASVTFRATLTQGGNDVSFTEKSTFVKDDGNWYYQSAEILPEK